MLPRAGLAGLVTSALVVGSATAQECSTVEDCLDALRLAAEPGRGIAPEEDRLARRVQSFGARAIPRLLILLEDESILDALTASRLRDDGWIPPLITRIGTPRAIEFLVSELDPCSQGAETPPAVLAFFDGWLLGSNGVSSVVSSSSRAGPGRCSGSSKRT